MLRHWTEFLSAADIEKIHNTSMMLLANVGVQFPEEEAIAVFKKHGVKADGQTVLLTEKQVMAAVQMAPAQFTIHARNPAQNVTIGHGDPVFVPAYGAPFLIDPGGNRRPPTMEDYHNLARLAHALPNQDLSGHLMVQPQDVPTHRPYLNLLYANIIHSDKPFMGSVLGLPGAHHTLEMAAILFGEKAREVPVTIGLINSLSPLGYSADMIEALMEYARTGQPVIIMGISMAGATGPITLAGRLAQQNAEILAGLALTQLITPGTPVVYGSGSTVMDMQTGGLSIGNPEAAPGVAATAQLARYYQLPSRSGGALTDAHTPGAQAGFESMFVLLATVNSGIDFVLHAAGILSSFLTFSYEKFVLDDELCGIVRHYRRGLAVTPETLAYEVIAKVGPGGHFLLEDHTFERCRSEFWQPAISQRSELTVWQNNGRQSSVDRARQRWQQLLAEHHDPPLDKTTARQLQRFVAKHSN
jgi:trimethylamine--corrinoid protein Co-methyltransferase